MTQDKYVAMLWNCPACGAKKLQGTETTCPNCGESRGDVAFYFPEGVTAKADPALQAIFDAGPDWVCEFCQTSNRGTTTECAHCAAKKGTSPSRPTLRYSGNNLPTTSEAAGDNVKLVPPSQTSHDPQPTTFSPEAYVDAAQRYTGDSSSKLPYINWGKFGGIVGGIAIILLVLIGAYFLLRTHKVDATVSQFSWERNISIFSYQTKREDGWSLPDGARLISQSKKQKGTESVKVGSKLVQVRDENSKYECGGEYIDNGSGVGKWEPDYCYNNKTITVDVYEDVPVYKDYYVYDIDRWNFSRSVYTSGNDRNDPAPYWGNFTLNCAAQQIVGCEREEGRSEHLFVHFTTTKEDGSTKDYTLEVSAYDWTKYEVGNSYILKVNSLGIQNDPLRTPKEN